MTVWVLTSSLLVSGGIHDCMGSYIIPPCFWRYTWVLHHPSLFLEVYMTVWVLTSSLLVSGGIHDCMGSYIIPAPSPEPSHSCRPGT